MVSKRPLTIKCSHFRDREKLVCHWNFLEFAWECTIQQGFADSQGLTHLHIWNLKLQSYIVSFAQLEASVMISKLALYGHIYKIQWSTVLKKFAHVAVLK